MGKSVLHSQFFGMLPKMIISLAYSLVILGTVFAATTDKLLKVQLVYRHGDRTTLTTYPKDLYNNILYSECEPGGLLNAGKQRQYQLGQWLRQRYSSLLPEKYSYQDIRIISDDMDRCLMSASSNLAGLYPPKGDQIWNPLINWQPIPIHTNASLLEGFPSNCPRHDVLLQEVMNSLLYQTLNEVNKPLFATLSQNTGENITSIGQVSLIRDILYVEQKQGLSLPSWTTSVYPDTLNSIVGLLFAAYTDNDEITKLNTGPLLSTIVEEFETATEKMIMYSAHDTNVANLVNYLSPLHPKSCIEFAATVIFELWQKSSGAQYVKLYLKQNDKVEQLEINNCGKNCEIKKLKSVLKNVLVTLDGRNCN